MVGHARTRDHSEPGDPAPPGYLKFPNRPYNLMIWCEAEEALESRAGVFLGLILRHAAARTALDFPTYPQSLYFLKSIAAGGSQVSMARDSSDALQIFPRFSRIVISCSARSASGSLFTNSRACSRITAACRGPNSRPAVSAASCRYLMARSQSPPCSK